MITDYTLMASLNNVERWGTVPHLRRQTVAAHSFDVCWTVDYIIESLLWDHIGNMQHVRIMRWAMRHDMTEGMTGDIPSPPKRLGIVTEDLEKFQQQYPKVGHLGNPDPAAKVLIKLADRLCMLRDAGGEAQMGNKVFDSIMIKCYGLAGKAWDDFVEAWPVVKASFEEFLSGYLKQCPPVVAISHIVEKDME